MRVSPAQYGWLDKPASFIYWIDLASDIKQLFGLFCDINLFFFFRAGESPKLLLFMQQLPCCCATASYHTFANLLVSDLVSTLPHQMATSLIAASTRRHPKPRTWPSVQQKLKRRKESTRNRSTPPTSNIQPFNSVGTSTSRGRCWCCCLRGRTTLRWLPSWPVSSAAYGTRWNGSTVCRLPLSLCYTCGWDKQRSFIR